ncbi:Ubiquitin carboxyl-terminal hydrolase-related protein [Melia azedarach]|nr:Ubiquitin carboxyl-terminal hydrolase-related protein [Melia azedarach]
MKALNKIRQSISNHEDSPHLYFAEALLHRSLAEETAKNSGKKLKHLNDAVHSAELAINWLPNSVHFALFRIDLHYLLATMNCGEWEKVIVLCDNALNIENPTDPGVDMFLEEDEMMNSSKESRIEDDKKQIINYLQASKCRYDILSALKVEELSINDKKEIEEEDNRVTIDIGAMKLRWKHVEAIVGDWIVKKQKTSHFSTKRFKGNIEKAVKYKCFWRSTLSSDEKRHFCMVTIKELERHFKSLKCNSAVDFSEAISFSKKYNTWKYWDCCCDEKFGDCNMYREHVMKSHGSDIHFWKKHLEVNSGWIHTILNDEWKPMDSDVARTFIFNHFKSKPDYTCDTDVSSRMCMDDQKWPYCVDLEREEILERIICMFLLLLRNKCLAMSHLLWPILYTIDNFEILIPLTQLCQPKFLKVICFLGTSQLEEILYFLENKAGTCDLTEKTMMGSFLDTYISDDPVSDIKERVGFSRDLSCLLVDGHDLQRELNASNYINGVTDNGSAVIFHFNVSGDDVLPDNDDLVSWLYEGPTIEEDLESWTSLRDLQKEKAKGISQIFDMEYAHFSKICEGTSVVQKRISAVLALERIYLEEIKQRENFSEYVAQHYVNLLRKRHKELQGSHNIDDLVESDVISQVLKEALAAEGQVATSFDQSRFEDCGAEDEMRLQEHLKQIDSGIRIALQRLSKQLIQYIASVDVTALLLIAAIQQYEQTLEKMSVYDHRPIIVSLLKSFLQTHLEDLFNEDAKRKSDAVKDAILAEIALDAEKSIQRGSDTPKQSGNNKKKKMTKRFRKAKETKATNGGKNFQLHPKNAEEDENQNSKIVVTAYELEPLAATEERLFEEHLEYQREFENEASLKVNVLRTGLRNEAADCFLNAIIQSLWNLREFREEFTSRLLSNHKHIGIPCAVCSLYDIFAALSIATADNRGETVAPKPLVIALRTGYENTFLEGQKDKASQFLQFILESLHESFNVAFSDFESDEYGGPLDCFSAGCFVHRIFGMDHYERLNCFKCHVESRHQKYTSLSLDVTAYNLRMMKNKHRKSSFDVLLKLAEMNGQLSCEGCGQINHIYHTLWCLPHIFTIVLGWQRAEESSKDISTTLSALSNELDLSVLFQGYQSDNIYFLIEVVCFSEGQQRYICFIYNHKHGKYVLHDDTTVKVIGSWNDVAAICDAMHLKPQLLFYIHKCSVYFGD